MKEENFSGNDSLQLIESMINKAKNNFSENGTLYLVWGYTILFCCLAQFLLLHFWGAANSYYVWFLVWVVLAYQMYYLNKKSKVRKVSTYTGSIIGFVWMAFGICMFLFIYILQIAKAYNVINPAILILYGVPTFLSGIILKFRPLIIGGTCCWIMALGAPFVPLNFQTLLIAAAVIAAWIIPGHLLRIRYKKQM